MPSRHLARLDPEYPHALGALAPPPAALWVRGSLPAGRAVAVVGTRRPSSEASSFAFTLAADFARAGFAVWSGGAVGIDTAAHEGALAAGGLTVVVAGGGLERPYPPANAPLFERVVASGGALVSVVDDLEPPRRWAFLARNSVLAAMTEATVLVEFPFKSGARSTSAAARRMGRAVWVAGQTPWGSRGAAVEEEVRLGARIFFRAETLIRALRGGERGDVLPGAPRRVDDDLPLLRVARRGPGTGGSAGLDRALGLQEPGREKTALGRVAKAVSEGVVHVDLLCERLCLSVAEVQAALTAIELGSGGLGGGRTFLQIADMSR